MGRKGLMLALSLGLVLSALSPVSVMASDQGVKTSFVHLAMGIPAVLYEPDSPGPKSQIGLFIMHPTGDYLSFSACGELSKRGYRVLCANYGSSKINSVDDGVLDDILPDVKLAVEYLHSYPGVRKVVLFGHSGGASIMTAYQDVALNGVKVCQDADKLYKCPDKLAGLPPADGIVLADANWGQAEMTLLSVDPAVTSGGSGTKLNPALDMFNPRNGFNPNGSHYSQAFIHRFQVAEGRRNDALIKLAQQRLAAINAGHGDYTDDEAFFIPGGGGSAPANKLFTQDTSLLSQSQAPHVLLRGDGSRVTEIIRSVRVPEGTRNPTSTYGRGVLKTTVRGFLSSYAVRVDSDFGYDADSIHGVDWTSTYASPPGNVQGITTPLLTLGMSGHWEGLAAETIYDHAKSADKTIAFVEGATHGYTPCTKCEKTPGQFGDTVKTTYDYIDGWLSKPGRFL